jgi:hypothetical protein
VVEHNLAKVGVASSSLVSRSPFWRRSQEAKAEVCKTSIHRFDSDRRLHKKERRKRRGGGIGRRKGLKIPRIMTIRAGSIPALGTPIKDDAKLIP